MTDEMTKKVRHKVILSEFKQGYNIKLYLVEAFGELNAAWFTQKIIEAKPKELTAPLFVMKKDVLYGIFDKEEVPLANHVVADLMQTFSHLGFIQEAGDDVVIQIGELEDFIVNQLTREG